MSEDRIIEKIGLWTLLSPPRWSEIKYYQIWHKRVPQEYKTIEWKKMYVCA